MDRSLGVAVVGAGYWGPNLIRNFAASRRWDLRWVVDQDMQRAESLAAGVAASDDLMDALTDDHVDAVALATPPGTHADLGLAVLEAGKHLLVEKPLAASYAAAEKLVRLADEAGLTLMCDHTYCYAPAVSRIREWISAGDLGDLLFVDSVRINLGLIQRDVDVLWDLAPHDLSVIDSILPAGMRPIAVSAVGADPIGAGQPCVGYLTLHLPGDVLAHVHVNWLSPTKVRSMIIGGSQRTVVWDDLNPAQRLLLCDRGVDVIAADDLDPATRRSARISYRSGDLIAPALPEAEPLSAVVTEFADAIGEGRPPLTDGHAGLRMLDLLEAASRSLSFHGAPVPLRGTP